MKTAFWQVAKVDIESVKVGNCDIKPTSSAGILGATFKQHITLRPHISFLAKSVMAALENRTASQLSYKRCCRQNSYFYLFISG